LSEPTNGVPHACASIAAMHDVSAKPATPGYHMTAASAIAW
jgi:hypothetical protein